MVAFLANLEIIAPPGCQRSLEKVDFQLLSESHQNLSKREDMKITSQVGSINLILQCDMMILTP